ncbi:MAG: hypothetical protein Q6J78_02460 [Thermostichales cyanobacterium SRBZ-1_bins_19]
MPVRSARIDRSRSNGDPDQFSEIAKEVLGQRTLQGDGKKVTDTAMTNTGGNPKAFLQMAAALRRQRG